MAPGMDAAYVVKDALMWEADTEKRCIKVRCRVMLELLERAWDEVALSGELLIDQDSLLVNIG